MKIRALIPSGLILFAGISILTLNSCKKHEVVPPPTIYVDPIIINVLESGTNISASFGGTILDQANNPISNALITVGNKSAYTDQDGIFYITNATVDSDRAYIKAEKSGYFLGSRAVNPTAGVNSYIKIKMLSKTSIGTISNASGGTVSIVNGPTLTFDAGDVSLANGNAYNGTVTVYASYLNPNAQDIGEIMPGDLRALDKLNSAVALKTFGMVAVELQGSNGEALNVAPNQTVNIKMPIQSGQLSGAGATIPLWYFDEVNGYWLESGIATMYGTDYVGEVEHFSFWNCDTPYPSVYFDGSFECSNVPLVGAVVRMHDANFTYSRQSNTDGNGNISEAIPAGIYLIMDVLDECGGIVYTQNIGNLSSNENIGTIQVCMPNNTTNIVGTILDCNNSPLINGLIKISYGGSIITAFTDNNGAVNASINTCSVATFDVTAYDFANVLESATMTFNSGSTVNLGTMTTCNQVDEYLTYIIDGVNKDMYDYGGSNEVNFAQNGTSTNFYGSNVINPPASALQIFIPDTTVGSSNNFSPWIGATHFTDQFGNDVKPADNAINVNVTTYGASIGSYLQGNFSGTFLDSLGTTRILSGDFRIRREF